MTDINAILLQNRGVLAISGGDAREFLQGLVSNDLSRVSPTQAIYAALLTPQGRYLHDFFIMKKDGVFFLDCEAAERRDDLMRRLKVYTLRSEVSLADASSNYSVAVLMGEDAIEKLGLSETPGETPGAATAFGGGVAYSDPRLAELGARALLSRDDAEAAIKDGGFSLGEEEDYERLRLELGIPDGSRDMEVGKALLLENGFDELHGVDWDKGCYMGQELTARTKHRGLVKKRLMPVTVDGPLPAPGTSVLLGETEAGTVTSGLGTRALALLRLEAMERAQTQGEALMAGGARLAPQQPDWMKIETAEEV
jgi:folate-binding protein YgfZ